MPRSHQAPAMQPILHLPLPVPPQSNVGRGLTNADVINDDAKSARVRLEGEVNGVPFVVERVAVRR
jgi:hypothetical protein